MSSMKRKQPDSDGEGDIHPSRQQQVYGNPKPPKKARKKEPTFKKQIHASSVNTIKKRIRDVSRRLERTDILANVRIEDERALAAYQQDLAKADSEKIRQKMIKRYHMVRFFERQKATRHLKKIRKQMLVAQSTEEVEELKAQMHIAEVDLNYTQFSPLSEIYVSLYPQKTGDEDKSAPSPKPSMWAEVEMAMEEGTLDKLRNRPAVSTILISKPKEGKMGTSKSKLKSKPTSQSRPEPRFKLDVQPEEVPPPAENNDGLNRRQRRALKNKANSRDKKSTKNKSMAFEKNAAFGSELNRRQNNTDDGDSDGGFFEE